MKQEIEAVKQFDSRISSAEHELLTLKHTVQKETSDIKDNFDHLQNLTSSVSQRKLTVKFERIWNCTS